MKAKNTARQMAFVVLSAAILLLASSASWAADDNDKDESDIVKRIHTSADVLDQIMGTPDKAIPDKIMSEAKCLAVIPSMIKIAVGFGGNHGRGVATCRTASGAWSAPAPLTITGGSWGLQLGGEATDLVLVIMNQKGMDHLLGSKFKLGADASAAAGPVGRNAGADTDWKMNAEVLSYSRSRGIFAGIDLNGAAITQDKDATRLLYGGKMVPFAVILNGKVPPPEGSHDFLAAMRKYSEQAHNHQGM
ncbi:MAG: lipid-binding SYLF domain-containing protein [Terriglobales bacterium]